MTKILHQLFFQILQREVRTGQDRVDEGQDQLHVATQLHEVPVVVLLNARKNKNIFW